MSTTTRLAIGGSEQIRRTTDDPPFAALATSFAGRGLAEECEEYFERGARVERGDVVLDIGANIGAFAAAVAARTQSDVTIHCFEPAAPLFEELAKNFTRTPELGAMRHVLHPLALTRHELHGTDRTFYYFRRFPTDSTYDLDRKLVEFALFFAKAGRDIDARARRWGPPGRAFSAVVLLAIGWLCRPENRLGVWLALFVAGMQELPCRFESLESVLAARGIDRVDLMKIDVEGAELDVLLGCGDAWPTIRRVAVETDSRGGRAAEVIALLQRHGLRITSCEPPRIASRGDAKQLLILAERSEP